MWQLTKYSLLVVT